MNTEISEQIELVRKIVNGELTRNEVEKELDRIAALYGEDVFDSYPIKRKPQPWTKEDLDELEVLNASGVSSRELFLYMADISDQLKGEKGKKKLTSAVNAVRVAINMFGSVISSFAKKHPIAFAVICIVIVSAIIFLIRR